MLSLIDGELIDVWFNWWCLLNKINVVVWCRGGRCVTICRVAMEYYVEKLCWEIMLRNCVEKLCWELCRDNIVNGVEKLWI
jgi:hypothetical protein